MRNSIAAVLSTLCSRACISRGARVAIAGLVVAIATLPAVAQIPAAEQVPNRRPVVAAALARYAGLAGTLRAYCAVQAVAWELRQDGAGTYAKPGGTNVAGRALDIVQFMPKGQTVDVIRDADGAHPAATWAPTTPSGYGPVARWRAPVDPASLAACRTPGGPSTPPVVLLPPAPPVIGPVVVPPPVCPVCPTCPPDEGQTVRALRASLAELEAKLAGVRCRARVAGIPIPCTVLR